MQPYDLVCVAGAAHLYGLTFDTPLGRPASEGDTGKAMTYVLYPKFLQV